MVEKWLHLNFFVGHPWGFLLVGAINNAVKAGRVPKPSNEQGQMPLYIATRLDMLPRIARRIGEEWSPFDGWQIGGHNENTDKIKKGSALTSTNPLILLVAGAGFEPATFGL